MTSPLVLHGRTGVARLQDGCVLVDRKRRRTRIPLTVIQEVRPGVEFVLTDGATHHVPSRNTTAAAAFADAVTRALPAERDPAGSALVTVEENPAPARRPLFPNAWIRTAVLLFAAGWTAHAVTAFLQGGGWNLLYALLGLLPAVATGAYGFAFVSAVVDRTVLRRRGITVVARRGPQYGTYVEYRFTDAQGAARTYTTVRDSVADRAEIEVVYHPGKPDLVQERRPTGKSLLVALALALLLAVPATAAVGLALAAHSPR